MLPQHSEHREALHADVALVRPLSGVRAHVLLQPRRSAELSAADATGELLRPLVELPVLQQLLHRQEVLLTQEAVKIHLPLSFRQTENNLKLQLSSNQLTAAALHLYREEDRTRLGKRKQRINRGNADSVCLSADETPDISPSVATRCVLK